MSDTPPRCFFIGSFGRSGTVWLSKLLNAHPEVLCLHEGSILHQQPRPWYESGARETLAWLGGLRDLSRWDVGLLCYRAVGDVNSIGGYHRVCPFANEFYRATTHSRLTATLRGAPLYLILRDPVTAIESKLRMLQENRGLYLPYAQGYLRAVLAGSDYRGDGWLEKVLTAPEATLRVMLMLHWRFVAQLDRTAVFRLEDLGADPCRTAAAAAEITGMAEGWDGLAAACLKPQNVGRKEHGEGGAAAVYASWSEAERSAFAGLCGPFLESFGYAPPEGRREPLHLIPLLDRVGGLPTALRRSTGAGGDADAGTASEIGVWGTGEAGQRAWEALTMLGLVPSYFVDNARTKQGGRFLGCAVWAPEELRRRPADRVIIASMYGDPIGRQLAALGVPESRILRPNLWGPRSDLVRQMAAALGIEVPDWALVGTTSDERP